MANRIEHRSVEANGINFHVAVSEPTGRRNRAQAPPPVLCLHGFPEGWMSWRLLMELMPEATLYAPDLRGYPGSDYPRRGYDVFTLTDDIKALIEALDIERPILLGHDWGGALGWIFAHRYSRLIRQLVVVNCPHPKTLLRAVLRFEDFQTLRIPWVPAFQVPFVPEYLLTTTVGRKLLELSFTLREGLDGKMDRSVVQDIVARFDHARDMRGAITYYRALVRTLLLPWRRARLEALYRHPITVPTTLVWGMKDEALSANVAQKSDVDAGCPVDWRPLEGVGHFVDLEAPDLLADELRRVFAGSEMPDTKSWFESLDRVRDEVLA